MADGSIRVVTKLDTKETKVDLKKFEQECEKTAKKIEQAGQKISGVFNGMSAGNLNSALRTANRELEKTEEELAKVEAEIAAIQAETDKMLPEAKTDEQAQTLLGIEEVETASLVKQRDELTAKAEEYKRKMEGITAELDKQKRVEEAQKAVDLGSKDAIADAEWLGKIKTEQEYHALLDQTKTKLSIIEQEAERIAQLSGVPVGELLQQNKQYQELSRRAALLSENQDKFKGKVSDSAKEVKKLGTSMTKTFEQGLKRVSKMAIGLLGARSAFMALKRAASVYMDANEDLKYQVEGLWNVLAVAIGPVVEQLVSWLTVAISYVNAFVKALWGVDLVAKANEMALKKQEKATKDAAKASQSAGFDEMTKLSDTSTSSSSSSSEGVGQIETVPVNMEVIDNLVDKFDEILTIVGLIGAGILAWKFSTGLSKGLNLIKGLGSAGVTLSFATIGLPGLLDDLRRFKDYCADFLENGATFENVTGMLTSFAGSLSNVFVLFGNIKLGGALEVFDGVGQIILSLKGISDDGFNVDNVMEGIHGIGSVATGIGLLTGKLNVAGWGMAIQGFSGIIGEISSNWEEIKKGDWSGVDKATMITSALEALGGIAMALDVFSKIKNAVNVSKAATDAEEVATATESVSSSAGTLSTKLGSLAKNLGVGILVIAEVAAAAILFVGAIWVLGKELDAVGEAWKPVMENGGTIAAAIGIGTGILVLVGAAAMGLGYATLATGGTLAAAIGLGIAILAEMGVATILFVAEIWAIGKELEQVGIAWKPVLANGETIEEAISWGTELLIAIGAATAVLGAATLASGGLLYVAIDLGTEMLHKLTDSFIDFTNDLIKVSKQLRDKLHPELRELNDKLPDLSNDMDDFTDFMEEFCGNVVSYSKSSIILGIATTIDKIIGFFTADPIKKMTNDVKKQYKQSKDLVEQLDSAIPKIKEAGRLLKDYQKAVEALKQETKNTDLGSIVKIGISLVTSGWDTTKDVINSVIKGVEKMVNGVIKGINSMIKALNKLSFTIPDWVPELGGKKLGFNLKTISEISIPRLARGGIVNNPGRGVPIIAGEAGREAVLPLENNTEWMDLLAEKINAGVRQIIVPIYLNGRKIAEEIINVNQKRNFATNGGVL